MKSISTKRDCLCVAGALLLASLLPSPAHAEWFRGNTHTHTLNSDGNASADDVVRWYRDHGYQFIVITDHEFVTDVAPLQALFGAEGKFLVMRGQEVSQTIADSAHPNGARAAHVNAINAAAVVMPIAGGGRPGWNKRIVAPEGTSIAQTYARNIAAIVAAGGIAQVNHPNFLWSVGVEDLAQLPQGTLFEVWNAHPFSHNPGGIDDAGHRALSTEALWDALLTRGRVLWGVGSDDSHEYRDWDDPNAPHPGEAWVMVRAERLTPETIAVSLSRGDFYASTGVTLDDISVKDTHVEISIQQDETLGSTTWLGDTRFLTRFVGAGGRTLAEVAGLHPGYTFQPGDAYVRAAITDSRNRKAWTQPVFVKSMANRARLK